MSNSSQNFHLSNLENILSVFQILNVFNSNKLRCSCRNGTFSGFSLNIYILISICFISTALPAVNARIWKLEILTPPSQVNKQSYQNILKWMLHCSAFIHSNFIDISWTGLLLLETDQNCCQKIEKQIVWDSTYYFAWK